MELWRTMVAAFFATLLFSFVETKKRKKAKHQVQVETLQKLCRGSLPPSTKKNILELQAFFDLSKAFACLKVETCSRVPVCFVEDTPGLGHESLSDCTLWNLLLLGLQKNRRIEPVVENPVSARYHGKFRMDYSWDEAVSNLCHGANVYRFVPTDTDDVGNTSSNATSRNSTATLPTTAPTTNRHKKRQGGSLNKFIKQLRKLNKHSTNSNSTCEELRGCQRICVGQNEQLTNVSDCRTFKIHCTSRKLFRRSAKSKTQKTKNKKHKPRSN
ncbi:uncharacterized protein LOC110042850 [Orbicella faveolata]|uniref:uncharacterized protein LOC110042850 n=1 Tax=Orbicella faveolata TaxID=48498 RepID=UPI0009E63569|nr:uncharacterized protein LOC110042850 [Orbicella faveolata]